MVIPVQKVGIIYMTHKKSYAVDQERIWALVSGLPSPARQQRLLFMLQAYIDDSGNVGQGKTCALAGYVATTEAWAEFSNRWAAAMKADPPIEYFKMSDAFALKKQFEGWTPEARDRKVDALVDVINATDILYGAAVVMYNTDYLTVAKGATDTYMNDPFYYLFTCVMETCLLHQRNEKIADKIDFIFDTTSKPAHMIDQLFKSTLFTAPSDVQTLNLVENPPIFRNEKVFLPLQAADLLVGQIRAFYEARATDPTAPGSAVMEKLSGSGVRVAVTTHDARTFKMLVNGTVMLQAMIKSWPEGQRLQRFIALKEAVAQLSREDQGSTAADKAGRACGILEP